MVSADKVKRLHHRAILTIIDRAGIQRKRLPRDISRHQTAIGREPTTSFLISILNEGPLHPRREVDLIVHQNLKPQEPPASWIGQCLFDGMCSDIRGKQFEAVVCQDYPLADENM